ncbi:hypothetical protein TNCV_2089341 [Trichonephila clavipes]|nr:hypothetical protein TNCV_2089341 [Trichonephila clavipes]
MTSGVGPVCLGHRQFGCRRFPGLLTNTRPSLTPRQNLLLSERTKDFHSTYNKFWLDTIDVANGNGLKSVEYMLQGA